MPLSHIIDGYLPYHYTSRMAVTIRKVTVNLPDSLLRAAIQVTGQGITDTIVEGLRELEKREKRSALRQLKGKVQFGLDLKRTR